MSVMLLGLHQDPVEGLQGELFSADLIPFLLYSHTSLGNTAVFLLL